MEILVNSCALPFSSSFSRALLRTATALGSAMVTYRDFVMDVGDMDDGESGNATTCRTSDRKGTPAADHRFSRYLLTLGCVLFSMSPLPTRTHQDQETLHGYKKPRV